MEVIHFTSILAICEGLIAFHQLRHTGGFRGGLHVEAVGLHDGLVVLLVGLAELRGHGGFIVEVRQTAIRVQGPGVQNGLGALLNLRPLDLRGIGPWEVVVDDIF